MMAVARGGARAAVRRDERDEHQPDREDATKNAPLAHASRYSPSADAGELDALAEPDLDGMRERRSVANDSSTSSAW